MIRFHYFLAGAALLIFPFLPACDQDTSTAHTHEATSPVRAPAVIEVKMHNMQFVPATLKIKKGDVVEWTNADITPHTATSASFDSGSLAAKESWRKTFTASGTTDYACTFHPTMKGVIIVE